MPLPLVERSEKELVQTIKRRISTLRDVKDCHDVSVRMIGKKYDVDMHVSLESNLRFEYVHKIASEVEREVKNIIPNARVTVHTEPVGGNKNGVWRLVKEIAEGVPGSRGVHNIHVQKIDERLKIDLHLEVAANITVRQAHEISAQVERKLREANPKITEITVHVESASDEVSRELEDVETGVKWYIEHVAKGFPEIKDVQGIAIRRIDSSLHVVLQCYFDSNISIEQAHQVSNKLEKAIKSVYPNIERIDVHEEPA